MTTDHSNHDPCCAPVSDTAMATGSEDGNPGEQPKEQLSSPDEGATAVEDSAAAVRAVRDESVLPIDVSDTGDEADPLTPEFLAPPED
jgi:hypothetical protein